MEYLLFKKWLLSEMADYGFEKAKKNKISGGTEQMTGDTLFKAINTSILMDELTRFQVGTYIPNQKWNSIVEWGIGVGAIQVECTTLGSLKIVTRRKTIDLLGEEKWICKKVRPLSDIEDENKEIGVAQEIYETAADLSLKMIEGPSKQFENFERLAWRLWSGVRKNHPSYCMFPVGIRKQDENYYKLVFEFKGGGAGNVAENGTLKQFNIDLNWDEKTGLVKCWAYNINSASKRSDWSINPSEWCEYFSPNQDSSEIIECIVNIFMQY